MVDQVHEEEEVVIDQIHEEEEVEGHHLYQMNKKKVDHPSSSLVG